ncbi:MAG: hypothetical protein ABIH75_01125 [Candidatus Omnitrophota bacterium]
MTNTVFRQAVVISLLGHLTLFGIFILSFGPRIPDADFSRVCFWGAVFRASDLIKSTPPYDAGYKKSATLGKSEISVLDKVKQEDFLAYRDYSKPPVSLVFNQEKIALVQESAPILPILARKETAIMFYPRLPYHFALYFKDRQTAHIELAFQVNSADKRNFVLVKRRISSGNLEVDLLSVRYISRYLFMQQRGFVPDKWQIVKIDLSTLND